VTRGTLNIRVLSGTIVSAVWRMPVPLRSLLWGVVPLLGAATAAALDPDRSISQYVHEAWQIDDGLPQSSVMAIVQAENGYLWLATQEGVVRFDGLAFTVLDRQSLPGLPSNDIRAIYAAPDGDLWLGTWGGRWRRRRTGDGLLRLGPASALFRQHPVRRLARNAVDRNEPRYARMTWRARGVSSGSPARGGDRAGDLEGSTASSACDSRGGLYRVVAGRGRREKQVGSGQRHRGLRGADGARGSGRGEGLLRVAPADGSGAGGSTASRRPRPMPSAATVTVRCGSRPPPVCCEWWPGP
jgi:hypothetical protein